MPIIKKTEDLESLDSNKFIRKGEELNVKIDKPLTEDIGLKFGEGNEYDVGISEPELDDRNEYRANQQTTGDKFIEASQNAAGIAGLTFVDATLGTFAGLGNLAKGGEDNKTQFADFWDNPLSNALTEIQEEFTASNPIYKTREEQELGLGEKMGTANFWSETVLQNLGFALGTMAAGAAMGSVFSGGAKKIMANAADDLVKKGLYQNADEAMAAIANGNNTGEVLKSLETQAKALKKHNLTSSTATNLLSSQGEARLEAINTKNEVFDKLKLANPELSEDELTRLSRSAGNITYAGNTALLSVTNARQMKSVFNTFENTKKTLGKIALETGEDGLKAVQKGNKYVNLAKAGVTGTISEGTEEQLQLATSKTAEDFYLRVGTGQATEDVNELIKSTVKGLSDAYGTEEGWENFIAGAILGTTGIPSVKLKGNIPMPTLVGGIGENIKDELKVQKDTENTVKDLNDIFVSDGFKTKYRGTTVASSYNEDKAKAVKDGSKFDFDNAQANQFILDSNTMLEAGLYDQFKTYLKTIPDTDVEQLRQAFDPDGTLYKDATDEELKDVAKKHSETLQKKFEDVRNLKRDIEDRFPTATNEYKTQLLQYGAIVQDVDARLEELKARKVSDNDDIFNFRYGVVELEQEKAKLTRLEKDYLDVRKDLTQDLKNTNNTRAEARKTKFVPDKIIKDRLKYSKYYNDIKSEIENNINSKEEEIAKLYSKLENNNKEAAKVTVEEVDKLHERKSEFGIKYLEGFGKEFQKKVDNTVKKAEEDNLKKAQDKTNTTLETEAKDTRDDEISNQTKEPVVTPTQPTGISMEEEMQGNDILGDNYYPEDSETTTQETVTTEEKETDDLATAKNSVGASNEGSKEVGYYDDIDESSSDKEIANAIKDINSQNTSGKIKMGELELDIQDIPNVNWIVQVFAADSGANLFRAYETEPNGRPVPIDNELLPNTNVKLLDPSNYPEGTKVKIEVKDDTEIKVYDKNNVETTWGNLKDTLTEEEIPYYIPIVITTSNGEKLGYIHTIDFINPTRVLAENVEKDLANLKKIRNKLYELKTFDSSVVTRKAGIIPLDYQKKFKSLNEVSDKLEVKIDDAGKVATEIPGLNDTTVSIPLKRMKVGDSKYSTSIKNTVNQALKEHFTGEKGKASELAKEYGIDILTPKGLRQFIKMFLPRFNSSSRLHAGVVSRNKYNEGKGQIRYAFDLKETTSDIEAGNEIQLQFVDMQLHNTTQVLSKSKLANGQNLDYMLKNFGVILDNLYVNVSKEMLDTNKGIKLLNENNEIESITDTYKDFIRSHVSTNMIAFKSGGNEYYRVNPILKYDFSELDAPKSKPDVEDNTTPPIPDKPADINSTLDVLNTHMSSFGSEFAENDALGDLRPYETSDEVLDILKRESSKLLIQGLSLSNQTDVVNSIVSEISKISLENNKATLKEITDPVFDRITSFYNSMKTIQESNDPIITKEQRDYAEKLGNNLNLLLENRELLINIAKRHIAQSSIVSERTTEDVSERDQNEFDKITYSVNLADKVSVELKKFLSTIKQVKDGKYLTNWIGETKTYDYAHIYENLQALTTGLPNDLEVIKDVLASRRGTFPWVDQIIDKLNKAPEYIQNQFVVGMTNHTNIMEFVLYDVQKGNYKYTVANANSNSLKELLISDWEAGLKLSNLVDPINYTIKEEKAMELRDMFNSLTSTSTNEEYRAYLKEFGIDLTDKALSDLKTSIPNLVVNNKSPLVGLNNFIKNSFGRQVSIDVENPIKIYQVLSLAETASVSEEIRVSNSFRSGVKTIYSVGQNKHLINRIRDLKTDPSLADRLSAMAFNKPFYWVKELGSNPKFKDVFGYFNAGLEAFKQRNSKSRDNRDLPSLSTAEIEAFKIALFQAKNNNNSIKVVSLTKSDKTNVDGLTIPRFPVEFEVGSSNFTKESLDFIFDQLVLPEMQRIIYVAGLKSSGKKINISGFDKGYDKFYFLPALNDIPWIFVKDEKGNTTISSEASKGVVREAIDKEILKTIETLTDNKVALWEKSGIGVTDTTKENLKFYSFLDADYMTNLSLDRLPKEADADYRNRKVAKAAKDMVVQYILSNANIHGTIISDPANFFKSTIKKTYTNIVKRLAGDVAPGMEGRYKEKNFKYLFLNDELVRSKNIQGLAKDLGYKSFSIDKYNKAIEDGNLKAYMADFPNLAPYSNMDGTDAQEYTTYSEHIATMQAYGKIKTEGLADFIIDTVAKNIKAKNYDYWDTLSEAVKAKFTEDGYKEFSEMILQPMKPVYNGNIHDVALNLERKLYIKTSSFPLHPKLGGELQKLRILAEKNNINRIVFASTSTKLGAPTETIDIWNKDGSINSEFSDEIVDKSSLEVPRAGFRIQQDIPYEKNKFTITRVSQAAKNLFANMLDVEGFEINGITYSGRELQDKYYELYDNLYSNLYNELRSEFEVEETNGIITNFNVARVKEALENEAIDRDYPLTDIQALQFDQDLTGISFSNNSKKLEAILNAVVSNRILKIKFTGKKLVLASESGMKNFDIKESGITFTDPNFKELQPSRIEKEDVTMNIDEYVNSLEKVCD